MQSERPGVVESVLDADVLAGFNCLGSSEAFSVVGCVVAAVSLEPFEKTEALPKARTKSTVVEERTEILISDVVYESLWLYVRELPSGILCALWGV